MEKTLRLPPEAEIRLALEMRRTGQEPEQIERSAGGVPQSSASAVSNKRFSSEGSTCVEQTGGWQFHINSYGVNGINSDHRRCRVNPAGYPSESVRPVSRIQR